jgi:proteasome lid subunit RPN8/RPN11
VAAACCRLPAHVAGAIVAHARRERPRECCGLLLGRGDEIAEAVPAENLSADPNRFLLDPERHIDVRRDARRRGLDVVGFYHSHPHSPAEPSPTDEAEAGGDGALHLIVSLQADVPSMRVFAAGGRGFDEVPIVRVP